MNRQRGYVTLVAALVLSLLVTLNVFLAAPGSVLEQRTANNVYRTEVAFENAEGGVRALIHALASDPRRAGANYPANPLEVATHTGGYTAQYVYNRGSHPYITSTGRDSGTATRTVIQYVVYTPGRDGVLTRRLDHTITALGTIDIGGNVSIESAKAGGGVTQGGNATIGTVAQYSADFRVLLKGANGDALIGADGNPIYRGMSPDEFFMLHFGKLCPKAVAAGDASTCNAEARKTVGDRTDGYVCEVDCLLADLPAQYALGKRVMWLDQGGVRINANVTLGSVDDPVLILVMNSISNGTSNSAPVQVNGSSKVYGILYVDVQDQLQAVSCSCTATIQTTSMATVANKTKYTPAPSGTPEAMQCGTAGGCTDSWLPPTTIPRNDRYTAQAFASVFTSAGATWSSPTYGLTTNGGNSSYCSASACTAPGAAACTPLVPPDQYVVSAPLKASCSYVAPMVAGSSNAQVQIEVLGTWDNTGGGHALIEGAVLTSGNFASTGGIQLVKNSDAVDKWEEGKGATAIVRADGWSDMN